MPKDVNIPWGSLKVTYIYTLITGGGVGLRIIFIPDVTLSNVNPKQLIDLPGLNRI